MGLSKALATWRKEVDQCRRVCSGSSSAAPIMVMASAKEGSISACFFGVRIDMTYSVMDGDFRK